ncbi:transposase [Nocardia camponoti]|uniref:transposase n=1 Tax=Nocardia camponoti TaxID=1616106 RepID=UPI00166A5738|nr:transposase [Nocardia camponoti]
MFGRGLAETDRPQDRHRAAGLPHTRRPIYVLTDRTAATLASWLQAHPGIEIICRGQAGAYAEGATKGAPDTIQVADRWQIWHNLGDAVERTVTRHRTALTATNPQVSGLRRLTEIGPDPENRHSLTRRLLRHGRKLLSICAVRPINSPNAQSDIIATHQC